MCYRAIWERENSIYEKRQIWKTKLSPDEDEKSRKFIQYLSEHGVTVTEIARLHDIEFKTRFYSGMIDPANPDSKKCEWTCPSCGTVNSADNFFFCSKCGHRNEETYG